MKIKSIHIDGFGKWVDQDFTITANPQVIFGNNEAGKTTLAVFIRSVLFGFANAKGKNRYQQYKPRHSAAYGGSLLVEVDGQEYRIHRGAGKGGGKVTVTDQAGHRFGAGKLAELLGNVDQELYQAVFGFSQADLAAVDDLRQEEVQHHLQQLGAVGSNEWGQFVTQLLKKGDELFKPRGRKPVLNQHLKEYQAMQDRLQAAREKYDEYTRLVKDYDHAQGQAQQLHAQLTTLQPRKERLAQLSRLWPVYAQWQRGSHPTSQAQISDDQVNQVDRLRVEEQELQRQVRNARDQLNKLTGQASQFDRATLTDYHAHQADYQRLQTKLLQLQAQADHYQQQERVMEDRFQERNQLQERYGHQLPQPLSETAVVQLENLQEDEAAPVDLKLPISLAAVGAVLAIIGLAGRHGLLTFLGLVAVAGAGFWYYHLRGQERQQAARHHQALAKFGQQHGLSNFPVSQWLPMQADLHRVAELNRELAGNQEQTARRHEEFTQLQRQLAGKAAGGGVAELARNFAEWLNTQTNQWREWTALKQQTTTVDQQLADLNHHLRDVQNEKWAIYQSVGVGNDAAFNHFLQERAQARDRQATTAAYEKQLTAQDKADLARFANAADLQEQLQTVRDQVNTARVTLQQAQEEAQHDQLAIDHLAADGTLAELEQRQANLAAQIWQEAQEWVAYQLAADWINRALVLASADRYPAIITAAEQFFATLTADRYSKILLNDDGVAVQDAQQEQFAVGELSTGTAEQLYVALRLGFISVMSDQVALPIMIDDGFVNFDHVRRDRIFALLNQLATKNQVLFFTANDQALDLAPVLNLNELNRE